ncbi:hypothetical protein TCAL_03510 [Tigriopus californicus]|uniref:G-protein coupled receptors family 1 profile domain-containing protein n=1 Tax=Tigriopus californicus TaxID=6832 RepID=A0A553PEQ0_TIGCA|nr:hypothetical protein TCAL_03510 [Tigriopus californicus]
MDQGLMKLSQDLGYVMYSAFGSFYIPSCIMVFVYIKIYYAARERARRNIKIKKKSRRKSNRPKPANIRLPPPSTPLPGSSGSSMANTPVVGNGSARVSLPTISGGHLENERSEACTPRSTTDNNNVPARNQSKSLATSSSSPMVLQSALKRNGSKPEKRTRFSFGSTENHRPSDSGSEQSVNKLNEEEHQLLQDSQRPGDEVSYHENGGKKYPPHPKGKKMVHILSAVSVSLNDAPLSLCDTPTPCDTPTSTGIPSPGPGHAYGACIGNGMRSRRSIGVSTRPDDNSDNENSEAGDRSSNSDSGKVRCLKLRSRFRAPQHGRRPSKETREMIDTGKLRKIHKAASVSSSSSFGGGGNKGHNTAKLSLDKPPKKSILSKSPTPSSKASPISGNGMSVSISGPGGTTVAMMPTPLPPRPTESEAEKEKKRVARKKERRATLILGLIMGSFIACWLPFFFLYSISPVCPICEEAPDSPCCVQGWGFSFAFWLGYSNSALNPVIYTIFNKDFRRAFKRILFK